MREIYKCPECGHADWKESYVDCDQCGDHSAVKCKNCGEKYDYISNQPIYDAVCKSYGVCDSWEIEDT